MSSHTRPSKAAVQGNGTSLGLQTSPTRWTLQHHAQQDVNPLAEALGEFTPFYAHKRFICLEYICKLYQLSFRRGNCAQKEIRTSKQMEPKWGGAPEKSQENPFATISLTATKELGNLLAML